MRELDDIVRRALAHFPGLKQMDIRHGQDHMSADCLFVRAILSDEVAQQDIYELSKNIEHVVRPQLAKLAETADLFPYFNYRNIQEEARLKKAQWNIQNPPHIPSSTVAHLAVQARLAFERWKEAEQAFLSELDSYIAQGGDRERIAAEPELIAGGKS